MHRSGIFNLPSPADLVNIHSPCEPSSPSHSFLHILTGPAQNPTRPMSLPGTRRRPWLVGGVVAAVLLVSVVAGVVGGLWPRASSPRASSSNPPPQDTAQVSPVVQITSIVGEDASGMLWEGHWALNINTIPSTPHSNSPTIHRIPHRPLGGSLLEHAKHGQ